MLRHCASTGLFALIFCCVHCSDSSPTTPTVDVPAFNDREDITESDAQPRSVSTIVLVP